MPEISVRFTVRGPDGRTAASWKCWSPSNKDDVYLACRELRGALQTSLHETGDWRVAYLKDFYSDFYSENVPVEHGTERIIDQWPRPPPIAPGVTLAFRVVTPPSAATRTDPLEASIVTVPAPAKGRAIEFDIILLRKGTPVGGWPRKISMQSQLVGSYKLPCGDRVFVLWCDIAMPALPATQAPLRFYQGKGIGSLKVDRLRMRVFADQQDGSKTVFDIVGRYALHTGRGKASDPAAGSDPRMRRGG